MTTDPGPARILFLVPSLRRAGAETQVVDLVNGLDSSRFDKHLAFFEDRLGQIDRVDASNVTVHRLTRRHKLDTALIGQLAEVIDNHRIEAFHCTLQISLFFAFLARLKARSHPRLITAIHTTLNQSRREELFDGLLYRPLIGRCDRVIFVCHAQAEHWIRKYPEMRARASVVYNGVDPALYDPAAAAASGQRMRERLGIEPHCSVIACIAGLRPEKGHEFLIEAFASLRGDPHLLLAGDGPQRPHLEGLLTQRALGKRVTLLGDVDDVRPVIAASDVTVLPSRSESFSMAMLESMAMAVPVIASNVGGLPEAITPGETGDLVAPGDARGLACALQRMLDDKGERRSMGERAREVVSKQFSLRAMMDGTVAILNDVLRGPRPVGDRITGEAN